MTSATKLQLWIACFSVSVNLGLFGSGLFGSGQVVFAQPAPPESAPIEENPAAVPPPSSWITFPPLSPSCPLPPIPLPEARTEGIVGFRTGSRDRHSVSSSYTQGDGSDSDLRWRILERLDEEQPDAALELASQIDDEFNRAESLRDIVRYYVEAGQLEQAETIALTMPEVLSENDSSGNDSSGNDSDDSFPSPREQAISDVATAYIQANQLEAALAILEHLEESSTLSFKLDIAQRYGEQGQAEKAVPLLDRTLEFYRNAAETTEWLAGLPPELIDVFQFLGLARFVDPYITAGQVDKATELASELFDIAQTFPTQDRITLGVLTGVAGVYWMAEQDEKGITVLNYVEQSTETLTEPYLKAMVLADVVRVYEIFGEHDRALEVLAQAQEFADASTDQSQRNVGAAALVQTYSFLGQYDDAQQIAEVIEPQDLREQVQQAITCAQTNP